MNIGSGGHYTVNQLGPAVDAYVGLHSEVPLVTLSGRLHVRITLLFPILGGAWSRDDAGVNDGAATDMHSIFLQVIVHQVEQLIAKIVFLHQVTELQMVVSSGTRSRPKSMPTKLRIARES